jgi:hypothetical protein
MLEGALDQLLAGLGLDVFERVVDVVEEVSRRHDLRLYVSDGALDFVEHVVEAAAHDVRELVDGVRISPGFGLVG